MPSDEGWNVHYSNLTMLMEAERETLADAGHRVTCVRGLYALCEQYPLHDCALVHPTFEYIRPLCELRIKYPCVGLVITPGYGYGDEGASFDALQRDCEGIFILNKPFMAESFFETIERAIAAARA